MVGRKEARFEVALPRVVVDIGVTTSFVPTICYCRSPEVTPIHFGYKSLFVLVLICLMSAPVCGRTVVS